MKKVCKARSPMTNVISRAFRRQRDKRLSVKFSTTVSGESRGKKNSANGGSTWLVARAVERGAMRSTTRQDCGKKHVQCAKENLSGKFWLYSHTPHCTGQSCVQTVSELCKVCVTVPFYMCAASDDLQLFVAITFSTFV